jgi:predicted DNA-binding transcriptional regulator YafY
VEFVRSTGAATAAARLGAPVEGHASRRRFAVRRMDAFARWLLSFGGDARPVSPESLVAELRDQATRTRALYDSDAARERALDAGIDDATEPA